MIQKRSLNWASASVLIALILLTLDLCNSTPIPSFLTHKGWYGITSKQRTYLSKQLELPVWRVEEYFSIEKQLSYSLYTQVKQDVKEKEYDPMILIYHKRKLFYLQKNKCQLDQRHEPTTTFPWKYNGYSNSVTQGPASILGVGGLWLNAIEKGVDCSVDIFDIMYCDYGDRTEKIQVRLDFTYPSEDPSLSLQQVTVDHKMQLHAKSTTFLQDIQVEATIESVTNSLSEKLIEDVEKSLKLCQDSLANADQHLFPSLMRRLSQSSKRSYVISSTVYHYEEGNVLQMGNSSEPKVEQSFMMKEWFSYDKELQAIEIQDKAAKNKLKKKYNRYMGYRDLATKQTAAFAMEGKSYEWIKCELGDFLDDKLIRSSKLMRRKIHFVRKSDISVDLFEFHAGTLIGLGALLMNIADIPRKKLLTNDATTQTWGNGSKSGALEWIVKDSEPSQRIHLYFHKSALDSTDSPFSLENLRRIEVRQTLEGTRGEGSPRESLVTRIEVQNLHMLLYEFDLDYASIYPKELCPDIGTFEPAYDSQGSAVTESPIIVDDDDFLDSVEEPYEFPSFDEYLDLTRDYSIQSEWKTDAGDVMNINEYLIVAGTLDFKPGQEYHFGRLDVSRFIKKGNRNEDYRLYISYLTGTLMRYETAQSQCHPIVQPDNWIAELGSEFKFGQFFDDKKRKDNEYVDQLKLYGVGGLWSLATNSPYLTFDKHSPKTETRDEITTWILNGLPGMETVNIVYSFTRIFGNSEGYRQKVRLNSIDIELDGWESFDNVKEISITVKEVRVGTVPAVKFLLPQTCNEQDYLYRLSKFPTFAETFQVKSPRDLAYEFKYDVYVFNEGIGYMMQISEVNKADGKQLGFVGITTHINNIHFWLDHNNKFLMEDPKTKQCKAGVDPIGFLSWNHYLDALSDEPQDILESRSSLPLAELWHLFGLRSDRLTVRQNSDAFKKYVEWTYMHPDGLEITFSFAHLHEQDDLHLHHVEIRYVGRDYHEFNIKLNVKSMKSNPFEKDASKMMRKPTGCYGKSESEFPKISESLSRGKVVHLSSELVRLKSKQRYTLDEWMQVGEAMRVRVGRSTDYLFYPQTIESFDISSSRSCPPVAQNIHDDRVSKLTKEIASDDFLLDSLFRARDENAFYGPLTLWSLAETKDFKIVRVVESISYTGLFDPQTSWFSGEQFQVIHRKNPSLKYAIEFSQDLMNGEHAILPQTIKLVDWRSESSYASKIVIQMNNLLVFGERELSLRENSQPIENNFLIPVGFGCRRGKDVSIEKLLDDLQDVAIFDPLIPTEFEYRASLSIMDHSRGQLEPQSPILSGWFGRCPDNWNQKSYSSLIVNVLHKLHLNGTVESERQISCKESSGDTMTQQRFLNQITGVCSINRQSAKQSGIITLDFGDKYQVSVPADWIHFTPSQESQVLRVSKAPGKATTVMYETMTNEVVLTNELSGSGSIVRSFERDEETEAYGNNLFHTSVKLDIYLLNQARLSLQIRNLRLVQCYEILKVMDLEDCYMSSEYRRAIGYANPMERLHQLNIKFMGFSQNVKDSEPIDFEKLKTSIENRIADQMIGDQLALVGLNAMQIGQVNAAFHPQDRSISARINLMELPPPIDRFVALTGKVILRRQSFVRIKIMNSKYDCSRFCESMQRCFAFAFCDNSRECRVIDVDMWIDELIKSGDIEDRTLVGNLEHLMTKDEATCTTYHSPSGGVAKTLAGSTLESMRELIENKMHFFIMVDNHTLEIHDYVAVEFKILNKFTDALGYREEDDSGEDLDSMRLENDLVFGIIRSDAQLHATDANLNELVSIKTRNEVLEADCLNKCTADPATCQLVSFCNHLCTTVGNLNDYETYAKILNSSQEQTGCSILGRDYVHDFHRFALTSEPEESMDKFEGISLDGCAARCHFKEGKKLAIDCLSFDYCTKEDKNHGTCYLQKLHLIMNDFSQSIITQVANASVGKEVQCAHYSKSLLADYDKISNRKFKHHQSVVHKGTTIDNCALICRRTDTCLGFEFCEPVDDENSASSCYLRRLVNEGSGKNNTTTTPSPTLQEQLKFELEQSNNCNVFRMRHSMEELEISGSEVEFVDPIYSDFVGPANLSSFFGYITLASFLGSVTSIIYAIATGRPARNFNDLLRIFK